uniref:Uncharacterized protein n=1 Tax=Arundo donax TaxID=35708 RepID=A0A0A9C3L0_ARUDO
MCLGLGLLALFCRNDPAVSKNHYAILNLYILLYLSPALSKI